MTPLTVAWISDFPVEWLPDAPEPLRRLPRHHPAMWELVLLNELEHNEQVRLHVLLLRSAIERSFSFQRNGVTFHVLKYRGGTRALSFYWTDTLLIRRALNSIQPHVVHAWGNEKGAALIASRLKYPFLMTVQGLFLWYRERVAMSVHDKMSVVCEKLSLARAKHVTVESNFSIEFIRRRYPRPALHKVEHTPNWAFHQVQRQPVTEPIRFLNIATTCHRKGTDLLLMALNELVAELPFRLVMIGRTDDPFFAPLRQRLSAELWQRVDFKAKLEPPEVAAELALATLFLFPTRADNSPNAVKEAVVAGVPVVASDVGGIPDYVVPGENGLLFKTGSLEEFTAAIRQACGHPLFRQGRVAPGSLERSRASLSPANMAKGFLEAYQAVIASG